MDIHKQYPRQFLSPVDDLSDTDTIRKAYSDLEKLPLETKEDSKVWCDAWNEIKSATSEVTAKVYFAFTRNTGDKDVEAEYERLAKDIIPLQEEMDNAAKQRFLSLPKDWIPENLSIASKRAQMAVEIFRESNLPLMTEGLKFRKEYQKITSQWVTEFDGKKMTRKQLSVFLESPVRDLRERAWRAIAGMHLSDYDNLNDLFDRALEVRNRMAKNADLDDFVEYQYRNYERLSYDRHDTEGFRNAIRDHVVPAVTRIHERAQKKLGLDTMRPWDTGTDPDGLEPPKIYEDMDDLKDKVARVLGSVDPQFADAFRLMDEKGYLDLENRPAKAPGAYMQEFAEERISMIFSNFVGTSRDFDTLLHEGGHAMHGFLCRHLPYQERAVPLEFAEVASMSLELLSRPFLDIVYSEDDRSRIGIRQLERFLTFLPFMASLDEFQAWVYVHPDGQDPMKRAEYWRGLDAKYRPHVDYSGLEKEENLGWQYLHVYEVPLYYIEYGIAQVGALQVFRRSLEDYDAAVRDYKHALSLGTTVGLPELFEAAGVKFIMKHPDVLKDVTGEVMELIGLE